MSVSIAPLKVAYFVPPSQHFAGIERVVHDVASGLAAAHPRLLDVHVVFASQYEEKALEDPPYTAHVLQAERLRHVAGALRRCVRHYDFDVLVTPQVEASVVAWLATRRLRLPALVPHLHGNPRVEHDEGTARSRAAFAVFGAVIARRVPAIIAVSPALRDYAAATLARRTPVSYLPNPVRNFALTDRITGANDTFRLVCVARLSRQKGQDILLRALALARPNLPAARLTLVGDGPAEAELRALSAELGLDDIVTFAGYATEPQDHLRNADVFVLASRWEGFGVALVEALRFGLPIVATACDFGPADIVTDPVIGALVPPEDPQALADALCRAARNGTASDSTASDGTASDGTASDGTASDGGQRRRDAARAYDHEVAIASHFSFLRSIGPAE